MQFFIKIEILNEYIFLKNKLCSLCLSQKKSHPKKCQLSNPLFLLYNFQIDGFPHPSALICSLFNSVYIASLWLRRGAFSVLWGQTGAVVGWLLAEAWISVREGCWPELIIAPSEWADEKWIHSEFCLQTSPDQLLRGSKGKIKKKTKDISTCQWTKLHL